MSATEKPTSLEFRRIIRNGSVEQLAKILDLHPEFLHQSLEGGKGTHHGICNYIVGSGDLERLRLAIKLGASPSVETNLLAYCIGNYERHKDCFDDLIEILFPNEIPFPYDESAWWFCNHILVGIFERNEIHLLRYLIKSGLDIPRLEKCAEVAVLEFALDNRVSIPLIRSLIKAGCSIEKLPKNQISPLLFAASRNPSIAEILKRKGASFGMPENEALQYIVGSELTIEQLNLFFTQESYTEHTDEFGRTVMHEVGRYGDVVTLDFLIEKQLPLHTVDGEGATLLHYAVRNSNSAIITRLLELGVNLNAQLEDGETAVDIAPSAQVRKKLLAAGGKSGSDLAGDNAITRVRKLLVQDEPWSVYLTKRLEELDEETVQIWLDLLQLGADTAAAKPTKTWQKKSHALVSQLETDSFLALVRETLAVTKEKRTEVHDWDTVTGHFYGGNVEFFICESSTRILKTLAWCCAQSGDEETCRTLRYLAADMYKKVYGVGMRNAKIANSAILALSMMDEDVGLKDIIALRSTTKYNPAFTHIERLFCKLAQDRGVSEQELAESSIPDYGLTDIGQFHLDLDTHFGVTLNIVGVGKTELLWHKGEKHQKTLPADIKVQFADKVKRVKALAKDLQQASRAHCQRLEQLYIRHPEFEYAQWRENYLDHRLIGVLARRLIWQFQVNGKTIHGIFLNGKMCSIDGHVIENLEDAKVSLWHPIKASSENIRLWRDRLFEIEVTQPFKQAHREIYRVTAAEKETATYSNRFANQILIHTQFNALATTRRWGQTRGGQWDGGQENSAYCSVGELDVEFEAQGSDDHGCTDSGIYRAVVTGAVRFYKNSKPAKLDRIDKQIFSELMRDVDLFVGVANIGNLADPSEYIDRGQNWTTSSFGELNETAVTRKEVLETIINRMSISSKLSIKGRYLHVQGNLRNYRIHLGSSNILMEPDDSYLCIVAKNTRAQNAIKLPFEGDPALSLIISKAILLASDDKIKDKTIVSQISRRNHASGE